MGEVGGAHEGIFSHVLQQIIKILVAFAVRERPSRTEEFLRIAVVTAIDRIIDGAALSRREKYGGRLDTAPDMLDAFKDVVE